MPNNGLTDHSFSANEVSGKLTFFTRDTETYTCVAGGKECKFLGKFCVHTKWIIPKQERERKNLSLVFYRIAVLEKRLFSVECP